MFDFVLIIVAAVLGYVVGRWHAKASAPAPESRSSDKGDQSGGGGGGPLWPK